MTIWSVLCPSSSATVRRSTPAITSLLANVWRLQCHAKSSTFASSSAVENHPREPCRESPVRAEGKTGAVPACVSLPLSCPSAARATEFSRITRGSRLKLPGDLNAQRFRIGCNLARRLVCGAVILDANVEGILVADVHFGLFAGFGILEFGDSGTYSACGTVDGWSPDPLRIGGTFEANHERGFGAWPRVSLDIIFPTTTRQSA